eukprot:gene3513-6136_t
MLLVGLHLHVPLGIGNDQHVAYVDLWVETNPAVFYYWTTIMLSLVLTHIMLHIHRSVIEANACIQPMTDTFETLSCHVFFSNGRFFVLTIIGKLLLTVSILITVAAIVFGIIVPAFSFKFKGLAAWLLIYTGGSDERVLSVFSMAMNFPESAQYPNSGSTRFIQVVFTMFAIALPLLQQAILFVLWFIPMRPKIHATVFHLIEIVHAWAALEVFVLAIVIAILQLRPLAQFIIGNKCTEINAILKILFNSELHGDDKCFDVVTELKTGSFVLIGCSIFSVLVTLATFRLASQAVKERNGLMLIRKRRQIAFVLGSSQSRNGKNWSRAGSYYNVSPGRGFGSDFETVTESENSIVLADSQSADILGEKETVCCFPHNHSKQPASQVETGCDVWMIAWRFKLCRRVVD